MTVLVLLALGLLSLSSISLRGTKSNSQAIAQANARLSLQMALSQLQLMTGPDARVTAPASAVASVNGPRQLHGVWRSWEGLDHDQRTGRPISPDYDAKLQEGDLSSTSGGRFLGWLVSGEAGEAGADSPADLKEVANTVALLSEGSVGTEPNLEVHVTPTEMESGGAYAWWISGDNTKARLKPIVEPNGSFETSEQMLVSPGPDGSAFSIDDLTEIDKAISRSSLDFFSKQPSEKPSQYFHDVSTFSRGLLTNTANGGWRRDLSLLAENWNRVPQGFSSFTLSPGKVVQAGKSNTTARSSQLPLIYPWVNDWTPSMAFPDCVSWAALVDYATQYKQLTTSGREVARIMNATEAVHPNWADQVRRIPVLARVHLVIALTAEPDSTAAGKSFPSVQVNPVITLWNPYNVALDMSNRDNMPLRLSDAACPINFEFRLGGKSYTQDLAMLAAGSGERNQYNVQANIPVNDPPLWLPGEVRVYSPEGGGAQTLDVGRPIAFKAGYRPDSGRRYRLRDTTTWQGSGKNKIRPVLASQPSSTQFSVGRATLDATFEGPNVEGVGLYFTHKMGGGSNNSTTNVQCMLDKEDSKHMLGEEIRLTATTSSSLSSLASTPQPIVCAISGLRFGRDSNPDRNDIEVNGIHNMNPTVGFMVNGTDRTSATDLKGRFDVFPYNIQLFAVNDPSDPGMPSGIINDLEGYLGSGFNSSDGLSNLVLLELPTRPLRTLGDLQHFNVNACDDSGPYTLNAFGNSRPSPFIESDRIRVSGSGGTEIGHDHSYAINHVLLDDWFVSSVAPETREWSAREDRSMEDVYADHLSGQEPLPNHYYKPATPLDSSEASSAASDFIRQSDAWEKVAAELEVEGMFNINSTSELAWQMLLKRHFGSGNANVLTLDDSTPGNSAARASLNSYGGSPFPRTTLSSDPSAGGLGGGSLLSQPHDFTDKEIEALAREIVVEIKERGPFLSLSEFFNRQLSNDIELARAGAVESALLRLSEGSSSENPYSELQANFSSQASSTDVIGSSLDYPFPEAAKGNMAYGFPGWTRQADVLRSISGVLSARDDTFTIRAYGDAREPGSNKIISRAWCEAVVQRKAEYVDSSSNGGDDKYTLPSESTLNSSANQRFGRVFEIVSFRWLHPDEV
ncbi:hypothetical protein ACFQY0_16095 [Haloferula chungangensis]|uniref:Uncharacterized protein n=1 Tax=Haloferula chungangensis TaxID=1048331 RepID=A0ABW2LCK0_9BACT